MAASQAFSPKNMEKMMNTTTNIVRLPPRSIAPLSPRLVAPSSAIRIADSYIDESADAAPQNSRSSRANRQKPRQEGDLAPDNKKKTKKKTEKQTSPLGGITLTPPASVPTLADFDFMSPAPTSIHIYNSERGRPMFAFLRVPDNGGFQRVLVVHGIRQNNERWHLVDDASSAGMLSQVSPENGIPLYRLDKLTERSGAQVIVMFDEIAADIVCDALTSAGLTNFVVVSTMPETNLAPLSAREVMIWPNAGESGAQEALDVTKNLKNIRYEAGDGQGSTLGIDLPDNLPDGWNPSVSDPESAGIDIASIVQSPAPPEKAFRPYVIMPSGYKMTKTGLTFEDDDGQYQVTNTPFSVVAECDLSENGQAGLVLRWLNRGQTIEYVVQRGQISAKGSNLSKELRENRLLFPEKMTRSLLDFLGTVEARKFIRTVNVVGWDRSSGWDRPLFVMPSGDVLGGAGNAEIRFASPLVNTAKERLKYATSGTLQEWQEHIASRASANSRLILGICLALTSPLLKILGSAIEAGGVHIWGGNGLGKSTYSNVMTSVWGDPSKLMIEIDGTKTGFENAAELASCIGLCLEELKTDEKGINKEIGRIIYMWANRKGGLRSGPNIALRDTKEFDIMFCSTGEYHLKTVIEMSGGTYTGGIEARMTSIKAEPEGSCYGLLDTIHDAESSEAFVDRMKADCERYHGTAGRHFVTKLIEGISENGKADIRGWFSKSVEAFIKANVPSGADKMIHRVAKRFAIFASIGELARGYGTLPWSEGEAFDGVGACFQSWLDDRGGLGSREDILAVQQVRKFISLHRFSRFEDIVAARTAMGGADCYLSTVRDRVGYREAVKTDDGDDAYVYYVTMEGWQEICKGIDPARAAKAVHAIGALQAPQHGRGLTTQKRLPGDGKTRVYVVTPEILTAGDALDDD
ncbi:DUF927 domain-containing protein [Acetobacter sp.]|uniref:DUF927 domain-containing protein n=1 Tax=Acetobacter sp. TaxID=440 RepID=UPI0039E7F06E